MNRSDKSRFNLKTSFWNEDQITVKNAFEEFEGFDMRSDVGTMQATDLLALYLAVESKLIIKAMTTEYLMLGDHFCGHINLISSRLKITRLGHKLWLITYFEDLFMKYRSERKGKLSKYWSYISILPDSYPTVLSGWFSNWLFYLLSNPLSGTSSGRRGVSFVDKKSTCEWVCRGASFVDKQSAANRCFWLQWLMWIFCPQMTLHDIPGLCHR